MSTYEVTAKNYSESSENRIHSDEIARKFGFKGALVPGVAVYGHLTYPLVHANGEAWLGHSVNTLRLHKPAYDGDNLTLAIEQDGDQQTVSCHNPDGTLLATVISQQPQVIPKGDFTHLLDAEYKIPERILIEWDSVKLEQPFAPWQLTITPEENQRYTNEVSDNQTIFSQYAHPHFLCSIANTALTNEYVMPTWIHVGTETRHHLPVMVNDETTIKSVPIEKWENKGHQFIKLYVSIWRNNELTTDMLHTAIFKVAT
ncbi:MAG: hypothetical protein AAF541_13580 [Pseudomonadota bacterium]